MGDRSIRSFVAASAALIVLALAPARAHAQASPEAETLFRHGKELMKDGKLAEACNAFEASEKAEHNFATVLSLSDCREKNRQYASAWAGFLQAYSQTRNDPSKSSFASTAKQRAATLEPRLSYLTIVVPDDSRIDGLEISRDGFPIDSGGWNTAIPIDGGDHVISGKAPGHEPWSTKITVAAEHDKQSVEVPRFKALPASATRQTVIVQQVRAPEKPSFFTTRRTVALAVGGAGVVALAAGGILGLQSRSDESDALAACPPGMCSTDGENTANRDHQTAKRRALEADVAFGVGGAAVVAAGVIWYLDLRDHREHPTKDAAIRFVPTVGETTGFAIVGGF